MSDNGNLSRRSSAKGVLGSWFQGVKLSSCLLALLGSAILAFGLYNIHAVSHVTEGGVLGLSRCWSIGWGSPRPSPGLC